MKENLIVGSKEHYYHCISFIHFYYYGSMPLPHAAVFIETGDIVLVPRIIPPLTAPIALFEETNKSRETEAKCRKHVIETYAPIFGRKFGLAPDMYKANRKRKKLSWAFEREFFRFHFDTYYEPEILPQCPTVEQFEKMWDQVRNEGFQKNENYDDYFFKCSVEI